MKKWLISSCLAICALLGASFVARAFINVAQFSSPAAVTGGPIAPLYGVTFDNINAVSPKVTALQSISGSLPGQVAVRIVFDTGQAASSYTSAVTSFHNAVAMSQPVVTMGLLADSSYMPMYANPAALTTWTNNYYNALSGVIDIWEIGNEINGDWLSTLSNGSDVFPKMSAMYDAIDAHPGTKKALTFFYEGEPIGDPNNCIATDHGGNDMFTWINTNFHLASPIGSRPAETEKIRNGLDYVLISWYPDQCPGENPNWASIYTSLSLTFPNAKVGFGELGTANPNQNIPFEQNEITSIYGLRAGVGGLPNNYVSGVFWWYASQEMTPWPGSNALGTTLNAAISGTPPPPGTCGAAPVGAAAADVTAAGLTTCAMYADFTTPIPNNVGTGLPGVMPNGSATASGNWINCNEGPSQSDNDQSSLFTWGFISFNYMYNPPCTNVSQAVDGANGLALKITTSLADMNANQSGWGLTVGNTWTSVSANQAAFNNFPDGMYVEATYRDSMPSGISTAGNGNESQIAFWSYGHSDYGACLVGGQNGVEVDFFESNGPTNISWQAMNIWNGCQATYGPTINVPNVEFFNYHTVGTLITNDGNNGFSACYYLDGNSKGCLPITLPDSQGGLYERRGPFFTYGCNFHGSGSSPGCPADASYIKYIKVYSCPTWLSATPAQWACSKPTFNGRFYH